MIICLDKPEKIQYINKIRDCGGKVIECPTKDKLENLMEKSDVVQLEYINNPVIFKYLCTMEIPSIRLLVWSHNNGLYNPIIPDKLIKNSHKFIVTSACGYWNMYPNDLYSYFADNSGCVYSSGGFEEFSEIKRDYKNMSVGYFGSTNFSKMHPNYSDFINAIDIPNFKVKIIGDLHNKDILEKQSDRFEFTGFIPNIIEELRSINVLAYILNPSHYGTTENSLIECMSMGIVPIVLNNYNAEKYIIKDKVTGIVVNSPKEFAEKVKSLLENPKELQIIGNNASKFVNELFSIENTIYGLNKYYQEVMKMEKRTINFKSIFGNTPDQWFLSCQSNKQIFKNDGNVDLSSVTEYSKYMLFEETKGSAIHFSKYFPENERLKEWSKNLKSLQ